MSLKIIHTAPCCLCVILIDDYTQICGASLGQP